MNPDRGAAVSRLAEMIVRVDRPHPVRVCIDGHTGAGKTTLADELAPAIRVRSRPCIRASMDGFHRPRAERYRRGRSSPEGYYHDAFDYEAVRRLLLDPLGPRGDRKYQTASHDLEQDEEASAPVRTAVPRSVLVVDGSFLQRAELEGCWDFRVWVEVDVETARARGVARDRGAFGPEIDRLYRERYLPAQRLYVEEASPADGADVRFMNNDVDHPVLVVPA